MHARCSPMLEKDTGFSSAETIDGYDTEIPELSPGPLQGESVLLTAAAPSLQPRNIPSNKRWLLVTPHGQATFLGVFSFFVLISIFNNSVCLVSVVLGFLSVSKS